MSVQGKVKAITVPWIKNQKGVQKLTMLTAYDYPTARFLDLAGVEMILVGDSVATVLYGEPNTLSISLEDMIRHTQMVSRGVERALVIGDLPFMSYQVTPEQAVISAGRMIKEGRAQAVKLEGGKEMAETVRAITRAGIPVCAHIGLTPQSINALGTYRMHGKNEAEREYLRESAVALQAAGAFAVVLECVEDTLAREITDKLSIPTIGIGSGLGCDGEVLVFHDLMGLTFGHVPSFVKPAASLRPIIETALASFVARTKNPEAHIEAKTERKPDDKNEAKNAPSA